ncbi:hypothetical protein M0R45_006802 [Rubus argutus]|uniref:Uncharacterized protein n=1 Tax=Rubus argutus TaxID=59490 RepID=A0AAW1YSA3_RUBAR
MPLLLPSSYTPSHSNSNPAIITPLQSKPCPPPLSIIIKSNLHFHQNHHKSPFSLTVPYSYPYLINPSPQSPNHQFCHHHHKPVAKPSPARPTTRAFSPLQTHGLFFTTTYHNTHHKPVAPTHSFTSPPHLPVPITTYNGVHGLEMVAGGDGSLGEQRPEHGLKAQLDRRQRLV